MAFPSNLSTMLPAHLYQRPSHSLWFNPSSPQPFEVLPHMVPANFPHLFRNIPTPLERSMPVRSLLGDFKPSRLRPVTLFGGAPPPLGPIIHPAYVAPEPLSSIPITFAPAAEPKTPSPTAISRRFYRPSLSGGGLKELVEILNPTVHRDTVCSPLVEAAAGPLRDSLQLYPYDIPQEHAKFLQTCGIQASGYGYKTHPHPVHKTIEIHLLFEHWMGLCRQPSSVLFMKPSKFSKLQTRNNNFAELCNYSLVARDITRYPEISPSPPECSTWFMHDAIMYLSAEEVAGCFQACPHLERLYASLVVPPESSFTDLSLSPSLYRYRFHGDQLIYRLEENPSHSYQQPRAALKWLQTNSIQGSDIFLAITRLESWGPVHSLLITRGRPPVLTDDSLFFSSPDAVEIPAASSIQQSLRHRLVPSAVYHSLFIYVRAVRTLRQTDPQGYVRTQSNKPEYAWVTSAAWDNLQHFVTETAHHRQRTTYYLFNSTLARLSHWCRCHKLAIATSLTPLASASILLALGGVDLLWKHSIKHLVIAHRYLIGSAPLHARLLPRFLVQQHYPRFSLALEPRVAAPVIHLPFSQTVRLTFLTTLANHIPSLKRFLPRLSTPALLKAAFCLGLLTPPLLLLIRSFVGPDSPQSMSDAYNRYFHPSRWELSLERSPASVIPSPPAFLPTASAAEPTEPRPSDSPLEVPLVPSPRLHPDTPPPAEKQPEPTPCVVASPAPVLDASAPRAEETPAGLDMSATTVLEAKPPVQVSLVDEPPRPESLLNPSATQEELLISHTGTLTHTTPQPVTATPEVEPLMVDASGAGPVDSFSVLHPGSYLPFSGSFLSRIRVSSLSPAPYPALDCLLVSVAGATGFPKESLWQSLCGILPDSQLDNEQVRTQGLSTDHFCALAYLHSLRCTFLTDAGQQEMGMEDATSVFTIRHTSGNPGHFELVRSSARPLLNGARPAADIVEHMKRFKVDGKILPFCEAHSYTSHVGRAKNLISNMKNGFDGVLANIDPQHTNEARDRLLSLDGSLDIAKPRTVSLIHIAGFAGCGKSYPICQLLKTKPCRNYKIAVPTVELRNEWKDSLKSAPADRWRLGTWESSLLKSARIVVIDEVYKLPRGYLDLAIHADSTAQLFIVLGDPLQGEYHSTNPNSSNSRLASEIKHLQPYMDMYCMWSHRIPRNVARFFRVKTTSSVEGSVTTSLVLAPGWKQLTNSMNAARTLNDCGFAATTIASSQGSTYNHPACINLDKNSSQLSHAHSLVALTRSKVGIMFTGDLSRLNPGSSSNLLFSKFKQGESVDLRALFPFEFPCCPTISEPLSTRPKFCLGGAPWLAAEHLSERALGPTDLPDLLLPEAPIIRGNGESNAPQVSTHFLPETRRPLHFDVASAIPEPAKPSGVDPLDLASITPVYPGESFENLARCFLPAHDPEQKEIWYRNQLSNQFPHMDKEFHLSAQPSSLLAPVHSTARDPTLLKASIGKRLRFRPSDSPYRLTSKDEILGSLLFDAHCTAMLRSPCASVPFDENLFAECIALNEFAQLSSKTQAIIMANRDRSDPDWRWSAVRIFAKTQHKVNDHSIFGGWKACQTLALMHDAVVLLLGPVKKYQRIFDAADRPSNIFVYAGHTPSEMADWCRANLRPGERIANDYTSFDQSQHGEAVVFERKKMERLNIPRHLIDLHVHLKTNVSTQFGPLTCMRLTGEPGTYDDNTDYNLAVLHLEYLVGSTPCMVSGDDSLLGREPPRNPIWPAVKPLLALRFKKERTRYGEFCGYYVGCEGCIRSPIALFAKLMVCVDDGSIEEKMISYATEFSIGHSLGDAFWNLLPIDAVPYQSAVFDFFCRHAPEDVKVMFKLGRVEVSLFSHLLSKLTWLSYSSYAYLSSLQRRALRGKAVRQHFPGDSKEVTELQGELLHTFSMSSPPSKLTGGLLLPTSPSMSNEATVPVSGRPSRDDHRSDPQPVLPLAPKVQESQALALSIPFQWVALIIKSDSAAFTVDLAASTTLKKLTDPFRSCEITHLEVVLMPTLNAFNNPVTLHCVWTVNSIQPASGDELLYYGGQAITAGGPVSMNALATVPADLSRINPRIKSSVGYLDTPRLTGTTMKCATAQTLPLAYVMIRGMVSVSGPMGIKL
nr:polyprotein [Grapevine rupestris vein feathering virus]